MRRTGILMLVFFTFLVLAAWPQAQPQSWQHKIIVFDAPDAGTNGSYGQGTYSVGINDWGAITGGYLDSANVWHGFVRDPFGTITEFDPPDAGKNGTYYQGSFAISVNDWGAITGQYEDSNNVYDGFVRDPWGNITEFDAPDAGKIPDCQCQGTIPLSINNWGAITGWYLDSNDVYHSFVRDPWGKITEFDAPDAGTGTWQGTFMDGAYWGVGRHINSEGAITGGYLDSNNVYHGFLRHPDGTFTEFEPPGAVFLAYTHTVTSDGWINGTYWDANAPHRAHAWVRRPDGTFITFEAPGAGPGGNWPYTWSGTGSHDINPHHVIAGPVVDGNFVFHGYVRTPDGKITDFDAPGTTGGGTYAHGINSAGAIVGWCWDANGVYHGYLRLAEREWDR